MKLTIYHNLLPRLSTSSAVTPQYACTASAATLCFYVLACSRISSTSVFVIIIIGIQPLGRFGQRPELSQSTGIALVRCILGKFLGVVCHCFPPAIVFV